MCVKIKIKGFFEIVLFHSILEHSVGNTKYLSLYFKNNNMEIDLTADLSILKSKLNDLEMKKQRLRQRQDKIDDLALDTLYKMEALLAKVKSVQNLASNEETTTSASNDYGVQSEKQRGNFTTSCERAHCSPKILKSAMVQLICIFTASILNTCWR